jgi:hypothetical protein
MNHNFLNEIFRLLLLFFNIILLFCVYIHNKKGKQLCILNISILLLVKGINIYINKLDTEFISFLIIKIGVVTILFIEYDIFI